MLQFIGLSVLHTFVPVLPNLKWMHSQVFLTGAMARISVMRLQCSDWHLARQYDISDGCQRVWLDWDTLCEVKVCKPSSSVHSFHIQWLSNVTFSAFLDEDSCRGALDEALPCRRWGEPRSGGEGWAGSHLWRRLQVWLSGFQPWKSGCSSLRRFLWGWRSQHTAENHNLGGGLERHQCHTGEHTQTHLHYKRIFSFWTINM